jgi:hypothetical protein
MLIGLIGAHRAVAYRVYVLIAALVLATATLLFISIVDKEKTASAQSTSSGGGSVPTCDGGSITQARVEYSLSTLCVSEILTQAAQYHSQEMIDQGYFSHNSYNGESYSARLERFGYNSYTKVAENIAWGSGSLASPEYIFRSWLESSDHRANILDPDYREIGIGTASGEYQGYSDSTVYTVDFGARQSSAPEEANAPGVVNTPQGTNNPQGVDDTEGGNVTGMNLNLYQYLLRLFQLLGF